MSVHYTFAIDCVYSPELFSEWIQVQDIFAEQFAANESAQPLVANGLLLWIHAQSSLGRTLVQEYFGIDTTVECIFQPHKSNLYAASMDLMVQIIEFVIRASAFDFLFHVDSGKALLFRQRGKLWADSEDAYWLNHWEAFRANRIELELIELRCL